MGFGFDGLGTVPWQDLGGGEGGSGKNSTFLEYGLDAYQIKGNEPCINMVANMLPGSGVKMLGFIFFSEHGHVAYQI